MSGSIKIIRATTIPRSLNTFCKGMLSELSHDYNVIGVSSPGKELEEVSKREGVKVIAVPMERHISPIRDIKSLFLMCRVFRSEKPRLVHSMTPKAGLICMVAAWLTRVPLRIHTFTGLVFPTAKGIKKKILMASDWLICRCATHIIPEGEGVKNDLLNNGITKKKLQVLGFGNVRGVDLEYYSRRKEVKGLLDELKIRNQELFTFLFVGRIVHDKGINELVDAFIAIHKKYPQTRLWLAGAYEDTLDPISDKARKEISENEAIHALGRKMDTELLAYYAAADCFVFPSYREGFPNTVLEAGAMDLPCIVTDINGSREIISDGYNGLVIPPRNTDALLEAMKAMIENEDTRKSMASVARKVIASKFEQGFVRSCLYNYYKQIISENKKCYTN